MHSNNLEDYSKKSYIREINLREYLALIKHRFWIIILITVIATFIGYLYSSINEYTPLYETSTRIIFGSDSEDMSTLMVMIKDPIIMNKVNETLGLTDTADITADKIEVSRMNDSQVVLISVVDTNPQRAADIANTTALTYKTEIANILEYTDVRSLSEAPVSSNSITEPPTNITLISSIFGFVTGLGFIFLLDSLDNKIRKEQEIEAMLNVPVLGVVYDMNKKKYVLPKRRDRVKARKVRREPIGTKQN